MAKYQQYERRNIIASRKYGAFIINETRVILIDVDNVWVPTRAYPIWGSKEAVVGTVCGMLESIDRVRVQWDNGATNTFSLRNLQKYDKNKHGEPNNPARPGPNTSFRLLAAQGKLDYGG
jgi:hypothetical protein